MLKNMRQSYLITDSEFSRFNLGQLVPMPMNENARYRIRRWMNKFYHYQAVEVNQSIIWDEVKSLTVFVFSLSEKFFYSFGDLINSKQESNRGIISILEQLRLSYSDEWGNLIDGLQPKLSVSQKEFLRQGDLRLGKFHSGVIAVIEHWANMHIQSIYHTLESVKLLQGVYQRIAHQQFPQADDQEINALVKTKLQIIILHDLYPTYTDKDTQKTDIDRYLVNNPEIELHWPKDLLHSSKYGSFANIFPYIRGEFLLKLDSDHHADIEEIAYVPYLFKIFDRYPECNAIGFRLYAFNEQYNFVTHLASLSNNAWWVHDLRVKCLVGGGGVYGKMLIRTRSLLEKEFIQPDSVAEDMLAMARLSIYEFQIQFSELVEIGQGEDISYYGLKRKLGRYVAGAIESTATKLYKEMLISSAVPLHRKLESLFMVSYYLVQLIIALAHFLILFAWALNLKIMSFFPLPAVLFGYLVVALVDSFYVWIHMYEREGILRGTKRYLVTLVPMMLFHG
ncbi:MAG: hypothetical protein KKB89_02140, partial [Candidatus Omnitrophica bacterium]|nr:hypothetical protein [Candidatus Omnitrophota bacterium]